MEPGRSIRPPRAPIELKGENRNIEPYETEDWRSIHEAARHLVNRNDAPDEARPYIRELISGYYRWKRGSARATTPRYQSHGIRY